MDTDIDTLYWLAGLLEGEGFFDLPSGKSNPLPGIRVGMSDEDIISRVAKVFGANYSLKKPKVEHWSTIYTTYIYGVQAYKLMKMIYPMMGERRKQRLDRLFEAYM